MCVWYMCVHLHSGRLFPKTAILLFFFSLLEGRHSLLRTLIRLGWLASSRISPVFTLSTVGLEFMTQGICINNVLSARLFVTFQEKKLKCWMRWQESCIISPCICQHVRKQCSWFCCCCFLLWDRLVSNSYVAEVKCEPPDFPASSSQLLFIDSCFICNSNVTLTQAVNKYWTNNSRQKNGPTHAQIPNLVNTLCCMTNEN